MKWLLVLGVCGQAFAADVDIESYARESKVERGEMLARFQHSIESERNAPVKSKTKREVSEQRQALFEELQNPLEPYYGRQGLISPRVGACAVLVPQNQSGKVLQVIDGDSARIRLEFVTYRTVYEQPGDKVGSMESKSHVSEFILKGKSTSGMRDGGNFTLNGPYYISGNQTYVTVAGGSNTVFVLQPFDIEPYRERFTRKDEVRKWTTEGEPIDGILARYERGEAHLMKLDGDVLRVKFSSLSTEDKAIVRDWIQAKRKSEAK